MRSFKKKSDLGNGSHSVTGASPDGIPSTNPDGAGKSGESNDSEDDSFGWDDFNPDAGVVQVDLSKVGGIPGSSKQSRPESTAEILRRHQWVNAWHLPTEDITFEHAHTHLKHTVHDMESDELKAHLKTTGLLFKGVKSEISTITDKVSGIKENVDSSLGRMITKTQDATIIATQQDLHKSQQLLQAKMEAMETKFDLLLSFLLDDDAKKGGEGIGNQM